jgi:uncharacterized OB-fold protein
VVADVICRQCGHRNTPDSNFCSSCGASLAHRENVTTTVSFTPEIDADDDVALEMDDVPVGVGVLVVKRGPNVGSRFALDPDRRPSPRERHLPRRHHRLAAPRRDPP